MTVSAATATSIVNDGRSGRWHLAALGLPGSAPGPAVDLEIVNGLVHSTEPCTGGCCATDPLEIWSPRLAPRPDSPDQDELISASAQAMLASGVRAALVYPLADPGGDSAGRARSAPGWDTARVDVYRPDQHCPAHTPVAAGWA
jgi:hypothetical protein